jgi:hypothetical protein
LEQFDRLKVRALPQALEALQRDQNLSEAYGIGNG